MIFENIQQKSPVMRVLLLTIFLMLTAAATACPFCKSDTAKEIRASLFDQNLALNLFIIILPFFICSVIVFLIYHGRLPFRKK